MENHKKQLIEILDKLDENEILFLLTFAKKIFGF
jgi:hypothetical protein